MLTSVKGNKRDYKLQTKTTKESVNFKQRQQKRMLTSMKDNKESVNFKQRQHKTLLTSNKDNKREC